MLLLKKCLGTSKSCFDLQSESVFFFCVFFSVFTFLRSYSAEVATCWGSIVNAMSVAALASVHRGGTLLRCEASRLTLGIPRTDKTAPPAGKQRPGLNEVRTWQFLKKHKVNQN